MNHNTLTALELKVMQLLWDSHRAFVKDLLDRWNEEPRPAYNTISTIIRILEEKGFVGHTAHGRTHEYFSLIAREDYQKSFLRNAIDKVFAGSAKSLLSTLVGQEDLNKSDLEAILKLLEEDLD
jgi:predicted transcriptional regulator